MKTIIILVAAYLVLSVLAGIKRTAWLARQTKHFDNMPHGDIGYYEEASEPTMSVFVLFPLALLIVKIATLF